VISYVDFRHWPSHFKKLASIIILKPNKSSYDSPKIFWFIVLLNILEKLIEKVLSNRLQVHSNFIYTNQMKGIKQWSTTDTGIALTYLI